MNIPHWLSELPDPTALAVPLFITLIVIEIIYIMVRKKNASSHGEYETRDMLSSLMMGFGSTLSGALTGFFVIGIYALAYHYRLFDLGFHWWVFVLCFFWEDLTYYWSHRLWHERRIWWASHVVHHSSQHYNLSTALRQTWTGTFSGTWLLYVPIVLFGVHPLILGLFKGISLVYQFWIHTETIRRLGPLEWIFNTPSHHRVHHATNPKYLDANYAGVLIIWDRLFGTFVAEDEENEPLRYGIINNLNTFNPIRIAFHEWFSLGKDLLSVKHPKHIIGYLFGPPGWSPDGSRRTSKSIKQDAGLIE